MRAIAIVGLILALGLVPPAFGDINPVLNYQGSLKDSSGAAYPDGAYQFTFSIYIDSVGGPTLWTESQTLDVQNGLLHAFLGAVIPFDPQMFSMSPLWLGIQLESENEFSPRHLIGSAVYSFISGNALQLEGHSADEFASGSDIDSALTSHEIDPQAHRPLDLDASEVVSGVLDPARLPAMTIDSTDIVDGSIGTADLANASVDGNKLADGAVAAGHIAADAVNSAHVMDAALTGEDLQDSTLTGQKIAAGSIEAAHLSVSAFGGDNIIDESLTGNDLSDSTITGDKIASGSIGSSHLSGIAITGAQVTDNSLTGADIANGTLTFNDIGPNQIGSYHIQDGAVAGSEIALNAIAGNQIADESIGGIDIASNAISDRHIFNNSLTAEKLADEPGIVYAEGGVLSSVGNAVVNWMSVTLDAPSTGVIIVFMHGVASLQGNEIAQMSVSTTAGGFGHFGEAKIVTPTATAGGNLTISISEVFPVAAAGPMTFYGNVRSTPLSAGAVDFFNGRIQAIFLHTGY